MTIEELELELRERFLKKYSKEELDKHNDFFVLQLRGVYRHKTIKFTNIVGKEVPVVEISARTYQECFKSLLEIF